MRKNEIKKVVLDSFHYHEALDRTFMISQILGEFIEDHTVILKHKNVKKLIDKAGLSLAQAYQLIGQIKCDR